MDWLTNPPAPRAVMLSGARQVGKTTLLLQAVDELIARGVAPSRILYATFDHPFLKLSGIDRVLRAWREHVPEPEGDGVEYILLDEVQVAPEWATWIKHQVDFRRTRRIAVTGSAMPISSASQESGVGRWHTIKLPTLSFSEYLRIRDVAIPPMPQPGSLANLFSWPSAEFVAASTAAAPLAGHFHEYLLRGGFPQTARVENITAAQRLLREDIVEKVLKRDMTALFGVRRIIELEKLFVYLCMHDGGLLDMTALCTQLELNKATVGNFLELLEACNLIYKLPPYGYGKERLRARYKVYLADAAIAGSVLLRGVGLLNDPIRLGQTVECAFFKHVFTHYYAASMNFCYWRVKDGREVDIVAEVGDKLIPFEVKYTQSPIEPHDLAGLRDLWKAKQVSRSYLITRNLSDLGPIGPSSSDEAFRSTVMRVPALLACLWLSQYEHRVPERV
jgi:predicted AAA+ superfamily ATPase